MITEQQLQEVYEAVRTPYKYGAVIRTPGFLCDSPVVFAHAGKYYMSYVAVDDRCETGYRTHLAVSEDLLHFSDLGLILTDHHDWDSCQTGGYAQFIDNRFGASNEIERIDGQYLFAYLGGSKCGYEADPLSMGLATCREIEDRSSYRKLPEPILRGSDPDARRGETLTIYKGDMFRDPEQTLGHPYVMAYNAKDLSHRESIFLAVSDDGIHWDRFLDRAIISVFDCPDDIGINGDPQIVRMNGLYVMFYFVFDAKRKFTYNTFAVSEDLIHWIKWEGEPLMQSSCELDNVFAHKQWILKENGIVYQYYCAVNNKNERTIALATSVPLEPQNP